MKARNISRGFTIIELMVTVGVVAIMLSVAVPSISSMVKGNRLSTQINMVMADIHLARSESVKRGVRVIICRSASPNITTPHQPVVAPPRTGQLAISCLPAKTVTIPTRRALIH